MGGTLTLRGTREMRNTYLISLGKNYGGTILETYV
jgi:hypothetical protein